MGLLLDDGAIASLMRQMTGGGTATLLGSPVNGPDAGAPGGAPPLPPQMAAMGAGPGAPTMGAPAAPGAPPGGPMPTSLPAGPGLLDRIGAGIRHAVGGDVAPAGLEGLISPDDLNRAKTSLPGTLLNMLGGNTPAEVTRQKLMDMIANRQAVSGIMQQRQQQADFKAIRQKYAALLDAAKTVQDKFDVLTSMAGDLMRIGHPEGAKMAGVLKDLRPNDRTKVVAAGTTLVGPNGEPLFSAPANPTKPLPPVTRNTAQGVEQYDYNTGKWEIQRDERGKPIMPFSPPVQQSFVPFPGVTPSGNVPVMNSKTGQVMDSGYQPKEQAGVGSAINQAATARLHAAVSEMNNATNGMKQYEDGLQNGSIKISATAQLLGRVANAFTHDDPLSQMTQSGALATLNRVDPALARYIRRGLSFAEGESMISQRPSDFRTKMAAFLSTAASGASPEMVSDIQSRRNSIMTPLNAVVSKGVAPSGGKTDFHAKYGLTPRTP